MRFDRFSSPLGEPYIAEIEEIPFYHYLPGETVLVLEVPGCPLHCAYCDRVPLARSQDWSPYEPSRVADTVANLAREPGFAGIVWDGGEPSLHWDNVMECAHAVHALGRKVGVATNGGVTADLLADTPGAVDMLLVRFKGFAEETYRALGAAPGILASSQALVEQALNMGVHVELMLDIARQSHQQEQEYADMLKWILQDLRRSIPLHLRAIAPEHGFTIREGPVMPFLENLVESARRQHVGFVYLSNCHGHFFNNTMCPNCYSVVIDRTASPLDLSFVTDGKCGQCGTDLALTLEKENL
ncbi:MAG: radical SAM protein [Candidatus Cryosericum sp.]|nr:radical SAM protein [Candidatus Cryosericum sp.]HPS69482.1 radical SAM protein [Candidatus Cryosericum sp.]